MVLVKVPYDKAVGAGGQRQPELPITGRIDGRARERGAEEPIEHKTVG